MKCLKFGLSKSLVLLPLLLGACASSGDLRSRMVAGSTDTKDSKKEAARVESFRIGR